MPLPRVVVLGALLASLAFSAFWQVKMIREVNLAEGKRGRVPFLLIFRGGIYFLHRHARAVPDGTETRLVLLLLIPLNVVLVALFIILGRT
jgi:hypothetical protein